MITPAALLAACSSLAAHTQPATPPATPSVSQPAPRPATQPQTPPVDVLCQPGSADRGFAAPWADSAFAASGILDAAHGYTQFDRPLSTRLNLKTAGPELWFAATLRLASPLHAGYRNLSPLNGGQHWTLGFFADKGAGSTLVWNGQEARGLDPVTRPVTLLAKITFSRAAYSLTAWAAPDDGSAIDPARDTPFADHLAFAKTSISTLMVNADGAPGVGLTFSRLAFAPTPRSALGLEPVPSTPAPAKPPAPPSPLDTLTGPKSPLKSGDSIVFFGDSITEAGGFISMLEQLLAEDRPDLKVSLLNKGHSGYKVPDIQPLLQKDVLDLKPTAVVISIGINDVWHWKLNGKGTTRQDFEAGLRDMVARCQAAGIRVVLASPSVVGEKRRGTNDLDQDLDAYAQISARVARDTGAAFVDLRTAFFDALAPRNKADKDKGVLTTDGVHMLPAGDEVILESLAKGLTDALPAR